METTTQARTRAAQALRVLRDRCRAGDPNGIEYGRRDPVVRALRKAAPSIVRIVTLNERVYVVLAPEARWRLRQN